MIGLNVDEGRPGATRARHALEELALMAGFPAADGPPGVTVTYDGAALGRGTAPAEVVVPVAEGHVARDVEPETWAGDGGAPIPILYRAAPPEGEVLARTASGEPLLVLIGGRVHVGFDVAAAADYYMNGRGEVGWPRDKCGRPELAGAPAWRRGEKAVAAVNGYAALLARAVEAACEATGVPALRFRYWPGGAPFAAALSHDVDRLRGPGRREMLRASLRRTPGMARAQYRLGDIIRGSFAYEPLAALFEAERDAAGASTFFFGALPRGPMDYAYELAEVAPLVREAAAAGREVGLHSSYYTCESAEMLSRERELLAEALGGEVGGVRGHYLRLGGPAGWAAVAAAGFSYDASFGFASGLGWRGGAALPYRPYDGVAEGAYDFVEISPAVMDGTLFQYKCLGAEDALAATLGVVDEAARRGGACSLLWHYRAFRGGAFPAWGDVYGRAVSYMLEAGAVPMTHRAIAERYRLNRAIVCRVSAATGTCDITLPPATPDDVVFELPAGWRLAAGDVRAAGDGTFRLPPGATSVKIQLIREE
ncbi:MAG: hypothetical protein PVH29_02395 [Candidatus Zixiibacteriota bacterium]